VAFPGASNAVEKQHKLANRNPSALETARFAVTFCAV